MHPQKDDNAFMLDSYDIAVKAVSSVLSSGKMSIRNAEHEIHERANIALYNACMNYDPDRVKWITYLWWCSVNEALKKKSRLNETGMRGSSRVASLDDVDEPDGGNKEPLLPFVVGELMARLSPDEQAIAEMRAEGMTYMQIGDKFGTTRQAIQNKMRRAGERVRDWWEG